jgi:hypothetical protein
MFDTQLTIGLRGVGNDIPTHLGKIRPTLTYLAGSASKVFLQPGAQK